MSDIADIPGMIDPNWKQRLFAGLSAKDMSLRHASLAAGLGPGAVASWKNEGKDPSVTNLLKVCDVAELSVYHVLGGFDITPVEEEFLRALVDSDAKVQESVLTLLRLDGAASNTPKP